MKVDEFKYFGTTIQSSGQCARVVKKIGWSGWRRVTRVICDRRIIARMKRKVYKILVSPTVMYCIDKYTYFTYY